MCVKIFGCSVSIDGQWHIVGITRPYYYSQPKSTSWLMKHGINYIIEPVQLVRKSYYKIHTYLVHEIDIYSNYQDRWLEAVRELVLSAITDVQLSLRKYQGVMFPFSQVFAA